MTGISPEDSLDHALTAAVRQLRGHGRVALAGRMSDPARRWKKRLAAMQTVLAIIGGVGVLAVIAGVILRDTAVWGLLIPLGIFFICVCGIASGVSWLISRAMRDRLRSESEPVALDPHGVTLRGIGPIPWIDLRAPERRHITVKNDIGGHCTVMPLTDQGRMHVNQMGRLAPRVGPKPYLQFEIPYLLLPGIEGLSEDQTLQLFSVAHAQFARMPG